jgi:hypothetical protein
MLSVQFNFTCTLVHLGCILGFQAGRVKMHGIPHGQIVCENCLCLVSTWHNWCQYMSVLCMSMLWYYSWIFPFFLPVSILLTPGNTCTTYLVDEHLILLTYPSLLWIAPESVYHSSAMVVRARLDYVEYAWLQPCQHTQMPSMLITVYQESVSVHVFRNVTIHYLRVTWVLLTPCIRW